VKQYIDLDQWNELSESGKNKLTDYYFLHKEPWDGGCYVEIAYEPHLFIHYWTIGKMIEFLNEKDLKGYLYQITNRGLVWEVDYRNRSEEQAELVDGLWEAVKHLLETEDK
jgi:hypothetical protein